MYSSGYPQSALPIAYNQNNRFAVYRLNFQKGVRFMSMITLQSSSPAGTTVLSNHFIDHYMPAANGEFVKVYIYLLRILPDISFGLEQMADRLLCTERDILRALKYWEKEKLLSLQYNDNALSGITLLDPLAQTAAGSRPASIQSAPASVSGQAPAKSAVSVSSEQETPTAPKVSLTPDRVMELKQNDEIIQLLYIAEQYLGKTLTPSEMKKILYFYDELKLSPDLIEYLIEYCVGRGHKSIRYIETVALAWAKEGITTVSMAKEASSRFAKEYYTILKAMGISNRNPVDTEITLMNTWMNEYGFTMDIIQEACSRTVLQTGQPSFQYADKILSGWKDQRVRNISDIRLLDAEHKKRKIEKAAEKKNAGIPKTPNRFNNFHQRQYDFDEYEKKLLNQ